MTKEEIRKIVLSFLSVRKQIALSLTVVFCYLAIKGQVTSTEYITVFTMVIGFYFGRSTALDVPGEKQNKEKEEQ